MLPLVPFSPHKVRVFGPFSSPGTHGFKEQVGVLNDPAAFFPLFSDFFGKEALPFESLPRDPLRV